MKKIVIVLLLLVSVFVFSAGVLAQEFFVYENPDDSEETIKIPIDPAHFIGTVRFCVEETQRLPDEINSAICDGDDEAYNAKMAELASNIAQATSAMADAGIPNTLNLWKVYSILKTKECGSGAAATSHADWAREELDRVGQRIGAIEFDNCPYGDKKTWTAGNWSLGIWNSDTEQYDWITQHHDLLLEVDRCYRNGALHWNPISGLYNDGIEEGNND